MKAKKDHKRIERGGLNATNAVLCWKPKTSNVKIVPLSDTSEKGKDFDFPCSGLAAYMHIRKMNFEERKTMVFISAMHLIVRDGCDPVAVHRALLELEEYRDGCAADMPFSGRLKIMLDKI